LSPKNFKGTDLDKTMSSGFETIEDAEEFMEKYMEEYDHWIIQCEYFKEPQY